VNGVKLAVGAIGARVVGAVGAAGTVGTGVTAAATATEGAGLGVAGVDKVVAEGTATGGGAAKRESCVSADVGMDVSAIEVERAPLAAVGAGITAVAAWPKRDVEGAEGAGGAAAATAGAAVGTRGEADVAGADVEEVVSIPTPPPAAFHTLSPAATLRGGDPAGRREMLSSRALASGSLPSNALASVASSASEASADALLGEAAGGGAVDEGREGGSEADETAAPPPPPPTTTVGMVAQGELLLSATEADEGRLGEGGDTVAEPAVGAGVRDSSGPGVPATEAARGGVAGTVGPLFITAAGLTAEVVLPQVAPAAPGTAAACSSREDVERAPTKPGGAGGGLGAVAPTVTTVRPLAAEDEVARKSPLPPLMLSSPWPLGLPLPPAPEPNPEPAVADEAVGEAAGTTAVGVAALPATATATPGDLATSGGGGQASRSSAAGLSAAAAVVGITGVAVDDLEGAIAGAVATNAVALACCSLGWRAALSARRGRLVGGEAAESAAAVTSGPSGGVNVAETAGAFRGEASALGGEFTGALTGVVGSSDEGNSCWTGSKGSCATPCAIHKRRMGGTGARGPGGRGRPNDAGVSGYYVCRQASTRHQQQKPGMTLDYSEQHRTGIGRQQPPQRGSALPAHSHMSPTCPRHPHAPDRTQRLQRVHFGPN